MAKLDDNYLSCERTEKERQQLPNLLYLGDVPVESSYHGSALLFRLLRNYPPEKLRIFESSVCGSRVERRLPGIPYSHFPFPGSRGLHTRFHTWISSWFTLQAASRAGSLNALLDGLCPEAVLTVAHGYGWLTAAKYAEDHKLPLHLVVHDDWPRLANVIGVVKKRLEETFGQVYRQAGSRFCVSPAMCEEYRRRYGADGTVLYPSRGSDCPEFHAPPERLSRNDHPFAAAFAGTINSPGYARALNNMASALESVDGRLLIFGPTTADTAEHCGLKGPNVVLCGQLPACQLMSRLREEVDILFVPMSFDPCDRTNMGLAFPSKLSDCTAVGLPLLIFGPAYCSAVRWARENEGVATVVDNEDPEALADAVRRLAASPGLRNALGKQALVAGEQYFSHAAARRVFHQSLGLSRKLDTFIASAATGVDA